MVGVKQRVRATLLNVAYWVALARSRLIRMQGRSALLVLPPDDGWRDHEPHSFGDEMLLRGMLSCADRHRMPEVTVLRLSHEVDERSSLGPWSVPVVGFRNGWLALSAYGQFIRAASKASHFVVLGADVMDGAYSQINTIQRLRFLRLAQVMGLRTEVTGCSFNGTANHSIKAMLATVAAAGAVIRARDAVSYERMSVFVRGVRRVTDLAFAVDTEAVAVSPAVARIRQLATEWRRGGGSVIGVNVRGSMAFGSGEWCERMIVGFQGLRDTGKRVALIPIPHDTRGGGRSDAAALNEQVIRRVGGRLPVIGQSSDICSGVEAKQVARCCDVIVTGRMHLAIAALDQGVPAVAFGYNGKFEGLYREFGLGEEWIIGEGDAEGAVGAVQQALDRRTDLARAIQARVSRVRAAARRNLEPAS